MSEQSTLSPDAIAALFEAAGDGRLDDQRDSARRGSPRARPLDFRRPRQFTVGQPLGRVGEQPDHVVAAVGRGDTRRKGQRFAPFRDRAPELGFCRLTRRTPVCVARP